jgi:hypothetical protein
MPRSPRRPRDPARRSGRHAAVSTAPRTHDAPALVLRAATAADLPSVRALATQVFLDTYATEGIRTSLAREAEHQFSIEALEAVLGARALSARPCRARRPPGRFHGARPGRCASARRPRAGGRAGSALRATASSAAASVAACSSMPSRAHAMRAARRSAHRLGRQRAGPGVLSPSRLSRARPHGSRFRGERYENRLLARPLGASEVLAVAR